MPVPAATQVAQLIALAEGSRSPDTAGLVLVAALTGMRRGELCGLRWHDIDWDASTIAVRRSVYLAQGELGVKSPKSHQERTVAVSAPVLLALDRRLKRQQADATAFGAPHERNGFVWSSDEVGRVPLSPQNLTRNFDLLCQRAAKKYRGEWPFRFHDLRHFAATEMLARGIDPVTGASMLGHSHASTFTDIYGHVLMDRQTEAALILGNALSSP